MRWELLFGDLETQLHESSAQELERQINELARVETAQASLSQAVRGALEAQLSLVCVTGAAFHGTVVRVEQEWLLLDEGARQVLLPLDKILTVRGLGGGRVCAQSKIPYTLTAALRLLAKNRSAVVVELDSARQGTLRGVLDHVGADYVRLMQLADGVSRNPENLQGAVVIPLVHVASIASSPDNEF